MEKMDEHLLVRYLKGECSEEEQHHVEEWLQHPDHRQTYDKFKNIWDASGGLYKDYMPQTGKAWAAIEGRIARQKPSMPLWSWVGRVAAVLLVAFGIGWYVITYDSEKSNPEYAALKEFAAPSGVDSLVLSDGTAIWLNQGSALKFPEEFTGTERKVYLSGEAFFDVAKNADQPFLVETDSTTTRVLGTSFSIKTEQGKAGITVFSGKVAFGESANPANFTHLEPGEKAQFDRPNERIIKSKNKDPNVLSWKTGILEFQNTPLEKVVSQLSYHYRAEVALDIPNAAHLNLTARFEKQSVEEVLEVIAMTLDLSHERTTTGYLLKK